MASVGMSLNLAEVVAHWRRLDGAAWLRIVVATFILPPELALACYAIVAPLVIVAYARWYGAAEERPTLARA